MGFRVPAVAVSPFARRAKKRWSLGARPRRLAPQPLQRRPRALRPRVDPQVHLVPVRPRRPQHAHEVRQQHRPQLRVAAARLRAARSCPTRPRSSPSRARSAAATWLDSQQAHASDLADIEHVAERYKLPVYEGKTGDIFTLPDSIKKGIARVAQVRLGGPGRVRAHGDETADPRRAGRGRGAGARRSRTRPPRRRVAELGAASPEQLDAAIAGAREAARGWAATPAVERAELLHEVADAHARADRRARPGAHARGRQAADRELGRGRLDRRRVRLLRRDGPQLRRPRDPLDRGDAARARRQGADRRLGRDRALELPAAAALLEARAGAGRGQHGGRQAVRADPGLDPDAGRVLRRPAGRGASTWSPAPATWAPPWSRTRASTAWRSPARWPPARRWRRRAPSASRA